MKYNLENNDAKVCNIYESDNQVVTHLFIKENDQIPSHDSPMSVIVVIYEGEVEFEEDGEIYTIKPGDIVEMKPSVKHSLKAKKDSKLMVIKSNLK